jgi:hypothetical protein
MSWEGVTSCHACEDCGHAADDPECGLNTDPDPPCPTCTRLTADLARMKAERDEAWAADVRRVYATPQGQRLGAETRHGQAWADEQFPEPAGAASTPTTWTPSTEAGGVFTREVFNAALAHERDRQENPPPDPPQIVSPQEFARRMKDGDR